MSKVASIATKHLRTFTRQIFSGFSGPRQIRLSSMASAASDAKPQDVEQEKELPKLTAAEFGRYNRLATMMDNFHNHFRQMWTTMHAACSSSKRPAGMSIRQFLSYSQEFCHMLEVHHGIEERHVFPMLAKRMTIFSNNETMKTQHKEIHAGLVKLEKYVEECQFGEREYRAPEMKEIMDGFGEVLWTHLDAEVVQLGAENIRKFFKMEEIDRMIF